MENVSPERATTNDFDQTIKPDIFVKREENFVLWRATTKSAPKLVIGQLQPGAPVAFVGERTVQLEQQLPDFPDLWLIPANKCNLSNGQLYHYWFEVEDPDLQQRIKITDPLATAVDWRLLAPRPKGLKYEKEFNGYPAAVVAYRQGKLVQCDMGGETGQLTNEPLLSTLPTNNRLIICEIPVTWAQLEKAAKIEVGIGTFRDITALVDPSEGGANFAGLDVTQPGRKYLAELGVNAIELLPPADSFYDREWGYGPTDHFAPDFELGFPDDYSWPTPNRDLKDLVAACHKTGIRVFADVVMAFAKLSPYLAVATNDFFILSPENNLNDPDSHTSRGTGKDHLRNGWGGTLFRYAAFVNGYDPLSGQTKSLSPARQLMKTALLHWMNEFHLDGLRIDSVENVSNWEFLQQYKDLAREIWKQRFAAQGGTTGADERFLVVGEELWEPLDILAQKRLDGLWHDSFKRHIRAAIIGKNVDGEPSFERTVRKAIDCRNMGYNDCSQAIIYLTSHDVEGNERLYNYLQSQHVYDTEKRIKLGFVCLLTAVGIPMFLLGEEFADEHDLFDKEGRVTNEGGKQFDPVNFSRLNDDWRIRIKDYVARLIKLRKAYDALAVNDTKFIHVDFEEGKRVLVWQRGQEGSDKLAVVVANFSDYSSPNNCEYVVHNWPATPQGKTWFEITQPNENKEPRKIAPEWVGRESIYSWEAKVYVLI
ncbi:MAG TPA: alpha-amylase family glycosyl hydrolase [Bacillota bacterium]|nr:alpha-amylase family glycosyl hydrolase [Bacillota bacterium]